MTISVFLLDDHPVVRRGLRELLEEEDDIEVVGEASTAAEAVTRIPLAKPDVAVLDVRLPDGDGVSVCREVRSSTPGLSCLILTSFADDEALDSAVVAGASGFVLKQIRDTDLVDSIRRVAAGQNLIDPALKARAVARMEEGGGDLGRLTGQERRILALIAEGWTNRQIAAEMFLAEKTVKNYVSNMLAKLGMHRRTEAAVYATRLATRDRALPEEGKKW